MDEHRVALHLTSPAPRCESALGDLRERLDGDAIEDPDPGSGFFAVAVEAPSYDDAVMRVRNAIAEVGADECFELGDPSGYVPHDD